MSKELSTWKYIGTKVVISISIIVAIVVTIISAFILKVIPIFSGIIFIIFLGVILTVITIGILDSREKKRAGLYLGPFQIQILRVAVSLGAGQIIAGILSIADQIGNTKPLPEYWFVTISLFLAIPFFLSFAEKIVIDINHVGVATFFGGRRNWLFVVEGEYTWYGTSLYFGISREPIVNPNTDPKNEYTTKGEKKGAVSIGKRTLGIWNDRSTKSLKIIAKSKTNSDVSIRLGLTIQTHDPMLWMSFADAILQIANQARASILEVMSNFIDVDANPCQQAIKELLWGKTVFIIFTTKNSDTVSKGSVVFDNAGKPLYVVLGQDDKGNEIEDETEEEAIARLQVRAEKADPELIKFAMFDNGDINIYPLRLKESLLDIVTSTGSELISITVNGIDVSDTVKKAADQLAAENNQRAAEEKTANSIKNVAEILRGPDDELSLMIAAKVVGTDANVIMTHSGGETEGKSQQNLLAAATILANKEIEKK